MSRLIDADAFKEAIGNKTEIQKLLCMLIDDQPTAYDLEKVVAELENSEYDEGLIVTKEAIEIVKRGGVE